jgi:hypothetical protein
MDTTLAKLMVGNTLTLSQVTPQTKLVASVAGVPLEFLRFLWLLWFLLNHCLPSGIILKLLLLPLLHTLRRVLSRYQAKARVQATTASFLRTVNLVL